MNQTEFAVIMNRCKQIKDDAEKRILLKEEIINDARSDIIFEKGRLFVMNGMIKQLINVELS